MKGSLDSPQLADDPAPQDAQNAPEQTLRPARFTRVRYSQERLGDEPKQSADTADHRANRTFAAPATA